MVQFRQHVLPFEEALSDIQDLRRDSSYRSTDVQSAIQQLAKAEGEERGAVFTRKEVAEFILDLVGYINLPQRIKNKNSTNAPLAFLIFDALKISSQEMQLLH